MAEAGGEEPGTLCADVTCVLGSHGITDARTATFLQPGGKGQGVGAATPFTPWARAASEHRGHTGRHVVAAA